MELAKSQKIIYVGGLKENRIRKKNKISIFCQTDLLTSFLRFILTF